METLEALHRQIDNVTDMRSVVPIMRTLAVAEAARPAAGVLQPPSIGFLV